MSIQLKRSLKSQIDPNYILLQGQPGVEMRANTVTQPYQSARLKIGDGKTPWSSLPYSTPAMEGISRGVVVVGKSESYCDIYCDGTDDASKLNQAFATSNMVRLMPGTYTCNSTVNMYMGCVIVGAGAGETIIKFTNSVSSKCIELTPNSGYNISGITFDYSDVSSAIHCIYVQGRYKSIEYAVSEISGCKFIGNNISDSYKATIDTMDDASWDYFDIHDCIFQNCYRIVRTRAQLDLHDNLFVNCTYAAELDGYNNSLYNVGTTSFPITVTRSIRNNLGFMKCGSGWEAFVFAMSPNVTVSNNIVFCDVSNAGRYYLLENHHSTSANNMPIVVIDNIMLPSTSTALSTSNAYLAGMTYAVGYVANNYAPGTALNLATGVVSVNNTR